MSENLIMQDTASNQENSVLNLTSTAGQMLRQARLDAGLHIAALAVSLRVPVKRIEALENGQMDLLPDMVFVRALTSSICQALKIDAAPILDKLPKAALPRLNRDDVAINTPIGFGNANKDSWILEIFTSPLLLGVLFLCAGAVSVYFWPKTSVVSISQATALPRVLSEVGISQAKEIQVANDVASTLPVSASVALQATAVSNAQVVNALADAENLVTFKATGETWVEVKNVTGRTLFKKLLSAGESAGTSGAVPLTVIVGRADVTQVEVRGKPINLAPIAKSNVARFEVN
jgi:cytoskeleton protein RodZ